MNRIDRLGLDGHALVLLVTVLEERSVTRAAQRLGLTQSAVSHGLKRLSAMVGTPLFVKSGRGIVATARAQALHPQAKAILHSVEQFGQGEPFEPAQADLTVTIAANDLQRDLLVPDFYRRVAGRVGGLKLRVVPSDVPTPDMLREGRCDLLISPYPPSGTEILQTRLLQDRYVCFYDQAVRAAPASVEDYLRARHVTVIYPSNERLAFDRQMAAAGHQREIAIAVPSFSGIAAFLRGSEMLATMPSHFATHLMRDFALTDRPLEKLGLGMDATLPLFMAWHRRVEKDPRHVWLRQQMRESARAIGRA